jgi:hypothetical protein
MTYEIKTGAVLFSEKALLPTDLAFKSESCVPGWKIVTDLDTYALDRKIRKTGWTFFCIADEIRASVFGLDAQKMLHRAIEQILKSPKLGRFNCVEIAEVKSVGSVRFAGISHLTVSAHPRHIQQSLFLSAGDLRRVDMAKNGIAKQDMGFGGKDLHVTAATEQADRHFEEVIQ